jgi:hypothetical protein
MSIKKSATSADGYLKSLAMTALKPVARFPAEGQELGRMFARCMNDPLGGQTPSLAQGSIRLARLNGGLRTFRLNTAPLVRVFS